VGLFKQALMIMTLGMGLTFVFLYFVIQGLKLAARIIHYYEGDPREEPVQPVQPAAASGGEAALHAAVIAVALEVSKSSTHQRV
jgi:Na+-transporting methylmalonyl-CoA/oxaloacetate decarboxylase gamma subunit